MSLDLVTQRQVDLGAAQFFRPEAEDPPGNQVVVKAGFAFRGGFSVVDQFTGGDQTTAGFSSVTPGFKRYDLVYINATGAVTILQGTEVAVAAPVFDGAPGFNLGPDLPDQAVPVAYVLVDETGAVTVDAADIAQITGFIRIPRVLDGYFTDRGLFGSAPAGASDDVSTLFPGPAVPGGTSTQRGVITTPSLNLVHLVDQKGDEIQHTTGARMFGRLTESTGTWTLTYLYLDATGAETGMDPSTDTAAAAPTDLRLQGTPEVFSRDDPARPLFPTTVNNVDQVAGDIPDASETAKGKSQFAADLDTASLEAVQGNDTRLASPIQGEDSGGTPVGGRYSAIRAQGSVVLTDLGGGKLGVGLAAASLIDRVREENTTLFNIVNAIPSDGTIPQITEGDEIESVTITPKAVGNKFLIRGQAVFDGNAIAQACLALFVVGTNDSIGVSGYRSSGTADVGYPYVEAEYTSVGTSPVTFTMRAGQDAGPTLLDVNQIGGVTDYGAASKTWMEVLEYTP